jgi:putative nucleotidyltransferase with HDIG domain
MVQLAQIPDVPPGKLIVVDADLENISGFTDLKRWMNSSTDKTRKVIFAVDTASQEEVEKASFLGADHVVDRSVGTKKAIEIITGELDAPPGGQDIAVAFEGMDTLFTAAASGAPINPEKLNTAVTAVVSEIESLGLSSWIANIREHHNQTYQHCLLVTGIATAFGQHLGFSRADRNRLALAGMLHDVGKSCIPVGILDKPAALSSDEELVMRRHTELGIEILQRSPDLQPEMIDVVLHHHEYLDGSGYPHGLRGSQISDLVRIITIADVFGALVERRAYKPPFPTEKAYGILLNMGPKLDKDLVREFGFAAKVA